MPKDFFELPSRKKSAKITRPLMPSAPRFVRVTSFRPNKGSERWLSHDLTPFRDALQVFSASLRKPARRYGYRGLKIFTSLTLRFQDFQRLPGKTSCLTDSGTKTWPNNWGSQIKPSTSASPINGLASIITFCVISGQTWLSH